MFAIYVPLPIDRHGGKPHQIIRRERLKVACGFNESSQHFSFGELEWSGWDHGYTRRQSDAQRFGIDGNVGVDARNWSGVWLRSSIYFFVQFPMSPAII